MKKRWMKIPAIIALVGVGIFVFSGAVMMLWNGILPAVLHVSAITFWQAAGILVLGKLLFGGFRRPGGPGGHWKRRMMMKWDSMTPEQQEKMRSRMGGCRGRRDRGFAETAM